MPAPIIRETFPDALEPGIREFVFKGVDRPGALRTVLFDIVTSTKNKEYWETFGAVGIDSWEQFHNTRVAAKVGPGRGYKTTVEAKTLMVEMDIEAEMWEDNLYPQMFDRAYTLGDSYALKAEYDAASVFNNAFTDTAPYAGADSVGLCSTLHPNGPDLSSTQSNEGTYSLTKANVSTVRQTMMGWTDDAGGVLGVVPDTILVPPELEDDAFVIARSVNDPTSANGAINPQNGRFNVLTWQYLTDSNAWFMIDSRRMRRFLKWVERVPFDVYRKQQDESAYVTFVARSRYEKGWIDWSWIYGNNPS